MTIEETSVRQGPYWDMIKGVGTGSFVAYTLAPILYLKNRRQTGQKFIRSDCMKGASLLALNVVPQAVIALTINGLLNKWFLKKNDGEPISSTQKIASAFIAGGASGIASTSFEFGVQNLQNKWKPTIMQVYKCAIKQKGITAVFATGSLALMFRELIYAPGYLVGAQWISNKLQPNIKNEIARDVCGAAVAGGIVGALTTPIDTLRANIQWVERNWSYTKTVKVLRFGILSGISARVGALVLANTMMTLGNKYL